MLIAVCMAVLCIQGLSLKAEAVTGTDSVSFFEVTSVDQIAFDNFAECTEEQARQWMKDNFDMLKAWMPKTNIDPYVWVLFEENEHYYGILLKVDNVFDEVSDVDSLKKHEINANYIPSDWGVTLQEEFTRYGSHLLIIGKAPAAVHTHDYAFSAEGDTITVNCDADGCTEPPYTATITLVAPTLTTEGGEGSPEATLLCTGIDEDFLAYWHYNSMEDFMAEAQDAIVYYNGDEKLDEAPTEAGDYTAKLNVYDDGVHTATISYTIAEAKSEEEPDPEPAPAPSAPIVISGTAKAASGGAPGLVSGTSESFEMLTWNAKLDGKTLTWEAKDGADGYVISIRAKGAKAFRRFDRVTDKSADLSKLKPGTYTVYVRYEKDGKLAKCRQSARTTIKIG